jgi:NAD+ kinase
MTTMKPILVNYKKSRLELHQEQGTPQVQEAWQREHDEIQRALERICGHLELSGLAYRAIYRADLEDESLTADDFSLIVSVGGDGTALEAASCSQGVPILGINPRTENSVGFYCPTRLDRFEMTLEDALEARISPVALQRIKVTSLAAGGAPQTLGRPALNDIFLSHYKPSGPTWYDLTIGGETHLHVNSGLLIATPAGTTGWAKQMRGAYLPLDSQLLEFRTNMAYDSRKVKRKWLRGLVAPGVRLEVTSRLRKGELAIDGHHRTYEFGYGDRFIIEHAEHPALFYGMSEWKRKKEYWMYAAISMPWRLAFTQFQA